ncbi:Hypothetical protein D9617_1g084790 [Elsinoe fawcettii]|nr:Hypothetical protein D9617_1g084790 [Elsinoe fawcettii]
MSPFTLSRVEDDDFPELIDVELRSFTDQVIRDTYIGPDTPEGREAHRQKYLGIRKREMQDFWIKVTEKSTGKIVAASNWKICPNRIPNHDESESLEFPWLKDEPEKREKAREKISEIIESRKQNFIEPYVQLNICFTDPAHERRGGESAPGSMMLKWGVAIADQMFLPAWIEASAAGSLLYKTHGFEVHSKENERGSLMYRPARPSTIEGGKPAP